MASTNIKQFMLLFPEHFISLQKQLGLQNLKRL